MKFLKNILKIVVGLIVVFISTLSCIPSEWIIINIFPISIPLFILIGSYCLTYKISLDELIDKFIKW